MLEDFRPVSACKSSHYDCYSVEIFILEAQETFAGTLTVNMINVLYFFVIYRLYLNYNAKLTAEWQVINQRHIIFQQCYSNTDFSSENFLLEKSEELLKINLVFLETSTFLETMQAACY